MSYQPYIKPPMTGITWASGGGTLQPIFDGVLSYQADAQKYADAIGAKLINGATDTTLGLKFSGVNPSDAAQPWFVQWNPGGPWAFAGIAINQQAQATFNLIGSATTQYPGTWQEQVSGVWLFIPNPAVTAAPAPVVSNSGDAASWAAILGVTTQTAQQFQTTVLQALAAIVLVTGAKPPTS